MYGVKNAEKKKIVFAAIWQSNMESSMTGISNHILSLCLIVRWKDDLKGISPPVKVVEG